MAHEAVYKGFRDPVVKKSLDFDVGFLDV